jgi:hypothetical protein
MAFMFRLEAEEGTPADPATLKASVPNWWPDDTIALGRGTTLRVIGIRNEDADHRQYLSLKTLPNGPSERRRPAEILGMGRGATNARRSVRRRHVGWISEARGWSPPQDCRFDKCSDRGDT